MTPSLTLACTDYEWLRPLLEGTVTSDRIELEIAPSVRGGERHERAVTGEFDVVEFSLGSYITGWPDWTFTALPVFPRRFFPHSRTFVRADADIQDPMALRNRPVWIHCYQNTLAIWARGIYADHYGLDPTAVDWHVGAAEPTPIEPPVSTTMAVSDDGIEPLRSGTVDAAIAPEAGDYYPLPDGIERLFPDLLSAEGNYFDETGYYPPMHTVVVRDELLEMHPWLERDLLDLFQRSYEVFDDRIGYEAKYPLVSWQSYVEQERERFGDVWARSFDLSSNEAELEVLISYAQDQGLIERRPAPDELFGGHVSHGA